MMTCISNNTATLRYHVTHVMNADRNMVLRECWEDSEGELHRLTGPALVEYTPEGAVFWEEWWYEGQLHRSDGPAVRNFDEQTSGGVISEEWWLNGKLHRTDGPAKVFYLAGSTKVDRAEWWIGGSNFDPSLMVGSMRGGL